MIAAGQIGEVFIPASPTPRHRQQYHVLGSHLPPKHKEDQPRSAHRSPTAQKLTRHRSLPPTDACCFSIAGDTAPNAPAAATASHPKTWCGRRETRCSTSSASPASSVENSSPPARSSTCSMRTGSSAKRITSVEKACQVSEVRHQRLSSGRRAEC